MAALAVAAAQWGAALAPVANVGVGARLFAPGEVFDGEALPAAHPLLVTAMFPVETEPASSNTPPPSTAAPLSLRRFCAWGRPGRMPYRGTVDEALRAVQLPPSVREQIVAAVADGHATARLVIGNDGIRAVAEPREFDPGRFAMTYGRTLCLGTRVNFKPGHVEMASLYEATDPASGRLYSVMVPDVCGNVSVLNRRPATQAGHGLPREEGTTVAELWDPGETGERSTHTAMTDKPNEVPTPGTLALTLLALGAALAVRRRARRPLP